MITTDTVFILGAGASTPYGYPTGGKLREDIYKNFAKRMNVLCRAQNTPDNLNKILEDNKKFNEAFFKSSTSSIDLFLARNNQFSEIGKLAIVSSILEAEKNSKFREDMDNDKRNQDWYSYLFSRMTEYLIEPKSYRDFGDNEVTFITFNYDRSFEHFLYESLLNSFYSAPKNEIINQMNRIPIYHIYGVVSKLPWQGGNLEYKGIFGIDHVTDLKKNIKIVYERTALNSRPIEVAMNNAKRIFFLGFGYAKENLNILNISQYLKGDKKVYGTALGLSKKETTEKRSYLNQNYRIKDPAYSNPKIENTDCLSLLREYL